MPAKHKRSNQNNDAKLLQFANKFALAYDLDLPLIAGKILGYLLVCDPPSRTQIELAEALGASRGSISTMTRLLERLAWIEKVIVPGERELRYRVRPEAWTVHVEANIQRANDLYDIAVEARTLFDGRDGDLDRIDRTIDFAEFWRSRLPMLLDEWREQERVRKAQPPRSRRRAAS